jgi:hypothetical protein
MINETIQAMLPINARARFSAPKPDIWDELPEDEKTVYFLNICEPIGHICRNCADSLDVEYDIQLEAIHSLHFFEPN